MLMRGRRTSMPAVRIASTASTNIRWRALLRSLMMPMRSGLIVTARLPYNVGVSGITKSPTNGVQIILRPALGPIGSVLGVYEVWTAYPIP
jgi:hypothetical protein